MELTDVNHASEIERRIAYLLVYDSTCLQEIAGRYKRGMLDNKYFDMTARLATSYFNKKQSLLGDNFIRLVDNMLARKAIEADDHAELTLIYNSFKAQPAVESSEFELDEAFAFFRKQYMARVGEEVKALAESGKPEDAYDLLTNLETFERAAVSGVDVYGYDDFELENILAESSEPLFKLPGAYGLIMNDTLIRKGFLTFIARPKAGKTWQMLYLAQRARDCGCNVIYITAGDMTKAQLTKRVLQGDTRSCTDEKFTSAQLLPCMDCERNQKGTCFTRDGEGKLADEFGELPLRPTINSDVYRICCNRDCTDFSPAVTYRKMEGRVLSLDLIHKAQEKRTAKGCTGKLVVEHAPSGTLTVAQRRDIVRSVCRKNGWEHPDVIVVDYAGICAYEGRDERESMKIIYQSLRADADIFDCLTVSAIQANSSAFDYSDLSLASFSLDKRIFDEASAVFAINQTPEERKKQIWRIAALLKREGEYDETVHAECYGCLAMGSPHFVSKVVHRDLPQPKIHGK